MRVAIIADIHANLIALDAALADIEALQPDQIVCLGDVAATGPQPRQVVERLRVLGCPMVMGNADAWLIDPPVEAAADQDMRRFEEIDRWCAAQLSPTDLDDLRSFAPTVELPLGGRAALLCYHGSPRSYNDVILSTTPDAEMAELLSGSRATVLAGGHTHTQMLRRWQDTIVLNPGSVGLPYEIDPVNDQARNPAWAEYTVVSWDDGRLRVEMRRVPVDTRAVVRAALAGEMPHAEWWAKGWAVQ